MILERTIITAVTNGIKEIVRKFNFSSTDCGGIKRQIAKLNKDMADYQSELEKVQAFVRSLYENYIEGIITNDDYISFKTDYGEKAANLKEKIVLTKAELSRLDEILRTRELVAKSTKAFMKNGKLTADLISLFVERIEVNHNKEVNIEYKGDMMLGKEAV